KTGARFWERSAHRDPKRKTGWVIGDNGNSSESRCRIDRLATWQDNTFRPANLQKGHSAPVFRNTLAGGVQNWTLLPFHDLKIEVLSFPADHQIGTRSPGQMNLNRDETTYHFFGKVGAAPYATRNGK